MGNPPQQRISNTVEPDNDTQHRHARLRDHVDSARAHIRDYAIVLIDDEGRIAGWNRGAQQLLGYSVTEALDRPFGILFTPEDRAAGVPACELESAAQQGETNDDRWHQRHDG